ncbi:MAG: DUF3343 domain-containing protein [Clostridiales bacterium]|nr:DUF3343 domain-containing protein [Clostridiales bacterium]
MDYILIVYSNRTDTMRLYEYLRRFGIKSVIVPTPNELSASCGLSLKVKYMYLNRVLFAMRSVNAKSLYKIYAEKKGFGRSIYTKIS